MFLDFLMNLFTIILLLYLIVHLFDSENIIEYEIIKWFNRTFGFCKHNKGLKYMVVSYQTPEGKITHPMIEYDVRCAICDKKIGTYLIDIDDKFDIPNISVKRNWQWNPMTNEQLNMMKNKNLI